MAICPTCGEDNPERAKFCLACATALTQISVPQGEERKIVSVLFADLVGFTARSEAADPEDVRAMLRPYHTTLKREIERYGGVVEKFIGDAVMGYSARRLRTRTTRSGPSARHSVSSKPLRISMRSNPAWTSPFARR